MSARDEFLAGGNPLVGLLYLALVLACCAIPSFVRAARALHHTRLDAVRRGTHDSRRTR